MLTTALAFSGTAEPNAKVYLHKGATSLGSCTVNSSGSWTMDATMSAGTFTITAKATDLAGNIGPSSGGLTITVDTTPPLPPTVSSVSTSSSRTPTWTWTSGGGGDGGGYLYYFPITATWTPISTTLYTAPTALADGDYKLHVRERDTAGNNSSQSTQTITVNAPPSAPTVNAITPTLSFEPKWTWGPGGYGNGYYRYKIDSGSWSAETRALEYTSPVLPIGTHTLYVQAKDAGEEWSVSASKSVIITPLLPVSGTTGVALKPILRCKGMSSAISYEWYIGTGTLVKLITTNSNTATPTRDLKASSVYKWYVLAKAKMGETRLPTSGEFTFTTGAF